MEKLKLGPQTLLYPMPAVIHSLDLRRHILVVGEIIETYVNEECLTDKKPDPRKIDPLIYTTGVTQYQRFGEVIGRAFHLGKD